MEDNIREIQEEIMNENESLMAAVSRGSRLKEPAVAQAALKTVKACQNCSWVAAAATKKLECKNHNICAIVLQKLRCALWSQKSQYMRIQILYIIEEFLYIIEKICTLHY